MADIRAILNNSDFNLQATWFNNVVPGPNDVAYANGNTVFVSDTRTVQAISNASGTGIAAGGTFSLLDGCSLTVTSANGVLQGGTGTACVTTPNLGVGTVATIAGSFAHTASSPTPTLVFSTAGTINFTGSIVGASVSGVAAASITGTGTFNHTGNLTAGTINTGAIGLSVTGNANVNIIGNVTGANGLGISMSNGTVTVTGTVTGGTVSPGITNSGSSMLTVNGICRSSSTMPAIGAGSATQITRLSGPFQIGATGNINPVQAQSFRWAPTLIPTFLEVVRSDGSTKRLLYSADNMPTGGSPVAANVRQGTVYGPSSEFTGTLAVASPSSVALGVPTDNTVGTAVLTQANVLAALGMASGNLDAQLAEKATVDQVSAIVQGATSA